MSEPTACGWCGDVVYDWALDGDAHRWGACIDPVEAMRRERDFLRRHRISRVQTLRLRELEHLTLTGAL